MAGTTATVTLFLSSLAYLIDSNRVKSIGFAWLRVASRVLKSPRFERSS